ncbi:MAG: hypothetical protein AAF420_13355 [Pseudomonadota bacterium]
MSPNPDSAQTFDFDTPIDRFDRGSYKWDRYGRDVLPMWTADMDFKTAPVIIAAMQRELEHGVFGYSAPLPGLVVGVLQGHVKRETTGAW